MSRSWRSYCFAGACVATSALSAYLVHPHGHLADWAMIHLLGIVLLSLRSSLRVSVLASVVSIALFDFCYIEPKFAFAWSDIESGLTFAAMILVAVIVSTLSENLRRQERAARATAFRAQALYALNVELSTASDAAQLSAVTARHLQKLFAARVSILQQTSEGSLEACRDAEQASHARAAWLRREFTTHETTSDAHIWLPVIGVHSTLGVIGMQLAQAFGRDSEQGLLLLACANEYATASERVQLATAVRRTKLEADAERLRSSLLSAVSHDLKTPLATMIAAAGALLARRSEITSEAAEKLLRSMIGEGERLSRLIHNLLSVTRLESSTVELRRTPESIEDIVHSALGRFQQRAGQKGIVADLAEDLPLISAEPLLLEQVLVNLLENATRYAGVDATISVSASAARGTLTVQVVDDGPGISEDERDKVFEKFYRGDRTSKGDGGVGLGLTICRAIVRAHGGRIGVQARSGGGTIVQFSLPIESDPTERPLEASLAS